MGPSLKYDLSNKKSHQNRSIMIGGMIDEHIILAQKKSYKNTPTVEHRTSLFFEVCLKT